MILVFELVQVPVAPPRHRLWGNSLSLQRLYSSTVYATADVQGVLDKNLPLLRVWMWNVWFVKWHKKRGRQKLLFEHFRVYGKQFRMMKAWKPILLIMLPDAILSDFLSAQKLLSPWARRTSIRPSGLIRFHSHQCVNLHWLQLRHHYKVVISCSLAQCRFQRPVESCTALAQLVWIAGRQKRRESCGCNAFSVNPGSE